MTRTLAASVAVFVLVSGFAPSARQTRGGSAGRRNVIVFVADGLRHGSVNERDTPALWKVRTEGVHFLNSHSVFPTFTTANASAIATGHQLGDTGDFSNTIWTGYATFDTGNFNRGPGTPVPFLENDQILADLDDHFHGNYLGEETLIGLARAGGYNTAVIGKLGPTGIQAIDALAPSAGRIPPSSTLVIDDATGTPGGVPLPAAFVDTLAGLGIPPEAPGRSNGFGPGSRYNNGNGGSLDRPGTLAANVTQQQWFVDVATRAVLPEFLKDAGRPFALVFWSRDPDASQHNESDSPRVLAPGINGPTSRLGVRNADRNLRELLDWLDAHPAVKANTDVIVTSDHGFATVSRREIDRTGRPTSSEAAKHLYVNAQGRLDTARGTLPSGFLAIDLAHDLHARLFDAGRRVFDVARPVYQERRVDRDADIWERPSGGSAFLGVSVARPDGSDAKAIVAANGGSDLIYVPDGSRDTVEAIVALLVKYDYVSGVFVDDKYGPIAGTLPLGAINLVGSSRLPRPAIVVAFNVFYADPNDLQTAAQVSDTGLQEGQGMHGGFGRDSTWNNMAAIGPDFKKRFVDAAPVGNADIVPTLVHLLGLRTKSTGSLQGRVLREALAGGPAAPRIKTARQISSPADGRQTVLLYQELDGERYLDAGCFATAEESATTTCR
ncbi:MAG: alkaline phosphatase family protein [Betaproteobacteria bacterium]